MRIAILGYGNVAKALLPHLARDRRFEVVGIHSRSRPAARSFDEFLERVCADTLVELTTLNPESGEPASTHIRSAFARNMHVVTANKGPIAFAFHVLQSEAARRNLHFRFESTVMDCAPVFNQFRNNMPSVRVRGFTGVLNSTSKLVIEAMEAGHSFEDGIRQAQEMGIAEANASYDLEGWDSAAKTAALANVLLDARVTPQQVARVGIMGYSPKRIQLLALEGKTVRLVSRAEQSNAGLMLRVSPEELPRTDILASSGGTSNILLFHTDEMGTFGTVSIAPGVAQTAYGVYVDLSDIANLS